MLNSFIPYAGYGALALCILGAMLVVAGVVVRGDVSVTGDEVRRRWLFAAACFAIAAVFLMNWSTWRVIPVLGVGAFCVVAAMFFNEKRSSTPRVGAKIGR